MKCIFSSVKVNNGNKTKILELVSKNGGTVTSKEVVGNGIHRQFLKQLAESGILVQTGRGIYQMPDVFEDELYNLQTEYNAGVFSYETSLFLFNLLERTPFEWSMTFKGNYHSSKLLEKGVRVRLCKADVFDEGIVYVKSQGNHTVKAYCPERTLCEILKPASRSDIQDISFAFKEYVKRKDKNIPLLMEYSKKFKVEDKVRSYLEVLI